MAWLEGDGEAFNSQVAPAAQNGQHHRLLRVCARRQPSRATDETKTLPPLGSSPHRSENDFVSHLASRQAPWRRQCSFDQRTFSCRCANSRPEVKIRFIRGFLAFLGCVEAVR